MAREVSREGRLPNFLVIGAGKSGTTSLYYYLRQHPEIFMSPVKEPGFFALEGHPLDFRGPGDERLRETTATTLESYEKLFSEARGESAVGESSVLYLYDGNAHESIARHIPDVKLLAVLRNPVDRAYSAFLHRTRDGYETCATFEEALAAEPQRAADGWYYGWRYREYGFYHRSLVRYYDRFDRAASGCTSTRISINILTSCSQTPSGSSTSTTGSGPTSARATTDRVRRRVTELSVCSRGGIPPRTRSSE